MKPLPEKKHGRSRLLAISAILIFIAGAGTASWLSRNASAESSLDKPRMEAQKPPVFVALEPFTINLQPDNTNPGRFLQIAFTAQLVDESRMALFQLHMPQMRSRAILLFSGKRASEILTTEGKNQLSREIVEELNQSFKSEATPQLVSNVFLTSFVIQ